MPRFEYSADLSRNLEPAELEQVTAAVNAAVQTAVASINDGGPSEYPLQWVGSAQASQAPSKVGGNIAGDSGIRSKPEGARSGITHG